MKNNKILMFGALGLGAYLLLSGKLGGGTTDSETGGERMFTLPDGRRVPESELPSLGYVQYQGQWHHQTEFQAPAGTNTSSTSWLNYLNTALQTGQQLFLLGGQASEQFLRTIKSTAVDWLGNKVSVKINYGYQTYTGDITPTSNITKTYTDQQIVILGMANFVTIKLIKAGQVQKQATIDFTNKKLTGFSQDSVGVSGIYIGAFDSNIDTVTSMYGISGVKNKKYKYSESQKREINSDIMSLKYFVYNLDTRKIEEGYINKWEAEEEAEFGYNNAVAYSLSQLKARGIPDPRQVWKIKGIGSVYSYNHPKGITHCFDGTYSDSHKGACSYHGGAHEIKLRKGKRDYSGKGQYAHYSPYRKAYKSAWAKRNASSDRVVTL